MEQTNEGDNLSDLGKTLLGRIFRAQGHVKNPILLFKQEGMNTLECVGFEEESEKLHVKILYTIAELIRRVDPPELFVGYEGFYLMEETAAQVLVGTFYSDGKERTWVAQIHGEGVGEWQDVSDNPNRLGFEGLWKEARAYLWN